MYLNVTSGGCACAQNVKKKFLICGEIIVFTHHYQNNLANSAVIYQIILQEWLVQFVWRGIIAFIKAH